MQSRHRSMEATRISAARAGNSASYDSLRLEEEMEIQSLIHPAAFGAPNATGGNSFTALLGLTPNQAVELLHHPESDVHRGAAAASTAAPSAVGGGSDMWRLSLEDHEDAIRLPLGCSPTFPSDVALVERAARLSVFATDESPASSSCRGGSWGQSPKPKAEPLDSDGTPVCLVPGGERPQQRPAKRKDGKVNKAPAKKSKSAASAAAEGSSGAGDKLPYVHVRVRRGQATDSHSLAERARREKINARMKLLQELVPGCSKISGTALVLDEIINHVQSLQRQVEFLSMRLAAVNPRIDFPSLDSFLPPECGRMTRMAVEPTARSPPWPSEGAATVDRERVQAQQQLWHVGLLHTHQHQHRQEASTTVWTREEAHPNIFINPGASLFGYGPVNPVPLHPNQLKTEL